MILIEIEFIYRLEIICLLGTVEARVCMCVSKLSHRNTVFKIKPKEKGSFEEDIGNTSK